MFFVLFSEAQGNSHKAQGKRMSSPAVSYELLFLGVRRCVRSCLLLFPLRETHSFVLAFPCAPASLRETMLLAFILSGTSAKPRRRDKRA
jgi:hypothetical protein